MREEIIGPRYAIRLGDLKPWHVLKVTCLECRHESIVSPAPLVRRFGEHAFLSRIEDNFPVHGVRSQGRDMAKVFRLDDR